MSQQDVAGYATLRSLQRQQRPHLPNLSSNLNHSFGAADSFLDDLNGLSSSRERQSSSFLNTVRRLKARSLDRQPTHPVYEQDEYQFFYNIFDDGREFN